MTGFLGAGCRGRRRALGLGLRVLAGLFGGMLVLGLDGRRIPVQECCWARRVCVGKVLSPSPGAGCFS